MTIRVWNWDEAPPPACRGGAVTVGNFDGVHRGHVALLAELRRQAEAVGGPAVALTFDPHPLQLLRPELFQPVLTTVDDRAQLLCQAGADHVLILRTTVDLLRLSAAEFFTQVVRQQLGARAVAEGENFGFGRGREGNVHTLEELCRTAGLLFVVVPPLELAGKAVSSSRVRSALTAGDMREAERLLGRRYRLRGRVVVGQKRGRGLGFPTANLERVETLVPAEGVYAVRAVVGEGSWPAAANIGPNPTFGEAARKIEVHLIGFQGDLYDQIVTADFIERLRATQAFANVHDLTAQLQKDVEQARRLAQ
jgi:riboflavin kinase/FMN adenylyltransferase